MTLPCWHKSQHVSLSRLCSVTLSPLFLYSQQRKRTETIPRCCRMVFAIGFGCGPPSCQRSFHYLWRELQRVTFSAQVLLNPCRYPAKFCHPWLLLTSLWVRQHIQRFWPGQRSCWAVARLHAAPLLEFDDKTLDSVLCKSGFRACFQFFLNGSSHRCDECVLFLSKKDYE